MQNSGSVRSPCRNSNYIWLVCKYFFHGCPWENVLKKFSQNFLSKTWLKHFHWQPFQNYLLTHEKWVHGVLGLEATDWRQREEGGNYAKTRYPYIFTGHVILALIADTGGRGGFKGSWSSPTLATSKINHPKDFSQGRLHRFHVSSSLVSSNWTRYWWWKSVYDLKWNFGYWAP